MAMKCFEIQFSELANATMLCSSYQFHKLAKEIKNSHNILTSKVRSYCDILSGYAFSSEDYDVDGIKLVRIGDFDNQELNLDECAYLPKDFQNKFEKFLLKEGDILIAMTGATIGKSALVEELNEKLLLNQRVGALRVKDGVNSRFFSYLIKCDFFRKQVALASMGKSQSNISPFDILNIKIPEISKPTQDQIVAQIEPIERKIKDLKNQIKKPQEVINQVFAREFGFDQNLYNEFGKGMTAGTQIADNRTLRVFETDFVGLARSEILRFSTRYHNPPTKKLMKILDGIKTVKLANVLSEIIHRGASPKYDENGSIPVVKTGHLKNGYIEISQEEFVEEKFYKSSTRSQIKKGDILIASTGKGYLGKIDLVETDEDLVADGHLSILRIDKKKYNRLFLVYFFRSVLGYFQIERDFTGATNQIELYANEISNFLIPNLPLSHQQKIVDEIKLELDAQEKIKKQIELERQKIDAIIEQAIIS
jgi:type I restriction enzyme S subunit